MNTWILFRNCAMSLRGVNHLKSRRVCPRHHYAPELRSLPSFQKERGKDGGEEFCAEWSLQVRLFLSAWKQVHQGGAAVPAADSSGKRPSLCGSQTRARSVSSAVVARRSSPYMSHEEAADTGRVGTWRLSPARVSGLLLSIIVWLTFQMIDNKDQCVLLCRKNTRYKVS